MDILGPDRGKMTIHVYESDFQQVNLTPNGGVSPTVLRKLLLLSSSKVTKNNIISASKM